MSPEIYLCKTGCKAKPREARR